MPIRRFRRSSVLRKSPCSRAMPVVGGSAFFLAECFPKSDRSLWRQQRARHLNSTNDFSSMLKSNQGAETCNSFNIFSFSKALFLDKNEPGYLWTFTNAPSTIISCRANILKKVDLSSLHPFVPTTTGYIHNPKQHVVLCGFRLGKPYQVRRH